MLHSLTRQLETLAQGNESYAAFNQRIVNTKMPVIGVRVPDLRRFARELAPDISAADISKLLTAKNKSLHMCCWQIFIFIVTMYGVPLIAALVAWVGTTRAVALAYASVAVLHVVTWVWLVPTINHALANVWGSRFRSMGHNTPGGYCHISAGRRG